MPQNAWPHQVALRIDPAAPPSSPALRPRNASRAGVLAGNKSHPPSSGKVGRWNGRIGSFRSAKHERLPPQCGGSRTVPQAGGSGASASCREPMPSNQCPPGGPVVALVPRIVFPGSALLNRSVIPFQERFPGTFGPPNRPRQLRTLEI